MAKAKAGEQETAGGTARTPRKTAAKSATPAGAGGMEPGHANVLAADGSAPAASQAPAARGGSARGAATKPAGGSASSAKPGAAKSSAAKKSASPAASGAAKSAASTGSAAKAGAAKSASSARATRGKKPDLRADLRDFASARPSGWNHDDWLGFLDHLGSRGHDVSNHDDVGRSLERERLAVTLERIDGLDAGTVNALTDRFGTLYSLRGADETEIAAAGVPRDVAERIARSLREG